MPCSTKEEMDAAVAAASEAFKTWRKTSVMHRQRVLFELARLIRENQSEIAKLITREQGKTLPDAEGDVLRGLRMLYFLSLRVMSLVALLVVGIACAVAQKAARASSHLYCW